MGDQQDSVSVFHFDQKISSAKLKKYRNATSRGMAPAHSHTKPPADHENSTPEIDSTTSMEPAVKKPRLFKLNGPRRTSDDGGDTIAVAPAKRHKDPVIRFKYSEDMVMTPADRSESVSVPPKVEYSHVTERASPAASSGLSSLESESEPPSEKETSPVLDTKTMSSRKDYGDFMSYYIDGGDDEPEPISEPKVNAKPAAKPAPKPARRTPKPKASKSSATASQPPAQPPIQQAQILPTHLPQHQGYPPQQGHIPPPQHNHALPPQHPPPGASRHPHVTPAYLPGVPQSHPTMHDHPHPHAAPHPHQRPAPTPQPTIQFSDIVFDPPPTEPDTVAIMIKKLHRLSVALTTFGGAPPAPPLSPSPPETPVDAPTKTGNAANPLDNFLSFFDGGDDEVDELDRVLVNPGTPDGPLTHGIVFIQNALKSWAQQRVSQMYTQQYHQQNHPQQQSNPRRGPGRPRKFDEPSNLLIPNPIIQMDLASTPEGHAIKAFQAVLHSECLRVNVRLPAALASALRQLYMQIDKLINQGEQPPHTDWQCMSYSAQIAAHKTRVDRWKEHQAKVHEETQRQQSLANQNMMTQMGLPARQHYPMTAAEAERVREIELETRRAQAHAHQQPYIRQQHLNPLQFGPHSSGPPSGFVPSQPPNNNMRPSSAGPPQGKGDSIMQVMPQNGTQSQASPSAGVQLDKMKMYVPGYLPRSGQNIKYSFGPQGDAGMQVFAPVTLPSAASPSSNTHNRGPMSAPPAHASPQQVLAVVSASTAETRPATAPLRPDPMDADSGRSSQQIEARQPLVQSLTPAENTAQPSNGNFRAHQRPQTPVVATHGFTAVNAPAPRTDSVPACSPTDTSPETIKVASRKPAGNETTSPRGSNKRSASEMNGHVKNTSMPSKFPHPGAIVVDQ